MQNKLEINNYNCDFNISNEIDIQPYARMFTCLFAGSWPLLSIMSSEGRNLNVNVAQDIKGVPSYKTITFAYSGIKAPPVRANANTTEVNSPR